jgi:hypothetical protein
MTKGYHDPNTGAYLDIGEYSLEFLESLPTLGDSHFDDLKIEHFPYRVWLSRCGVADGEPYPHKVTIEKCNVASGTWRNLREYQAQ